MPELPEVETVCRGLNVQLKGALVKKVEVFRKDSIGYPSVDDFCAALPGHRFIKVTRRGKYILIDLDQGGGLAAHLRMSGRLLVTKSKTTSGPFLRVRITFADKKELLFEDMRVFGRLWFKPKGMTFQDVIPGLLHLGVEPLEDLDSSKLAVLFAKKKQSIKSALMDQRLIAGIGNIYADESLFQAGIHPLTPAGRLKKPEIERLVEEIKDVLKRAIKNRGSSVRDYRDSEGVNGNYQNKAWVYGRTGLKCRQCDKLIERVKIAGRSAHYCQKCQPRKASTRNSKSEH